MRARHATILGLIVVMMAVSSASAYVLLSPRRTWPGGSKTFPVNHGHVSVTDSDQGITAVVNALNSSSQGWNSCSNPFSVVAVKNTSQAWVLGDNIPTVSLRREIGGCSGSCLAATYTGYYSGSTINDADVEGRRNRADNQGGPYYSNGEACTAGVEYGVEGIWVHEAGHQIGIGHSTVAGSTMYPSVSSCNQGPQSVAADDCAAADDLY